MLTQTDLKFISGMLHEKLGMMRRSNARDEIMGDNEMSKSYIEHQKKFEKYVATLTEKVDNQIKD